MTNTQPFLLTYAETLQRYGRPAHELESAVSRRAQQLGADMRILASPTLILVETGGQARLSSVAAGWIDLQRLDQAEQLADEVVAGHRDIREATTALARLPALYGPIDIALATITASAATAPFFGGGTREVAAAGLAGVGVVVGGRLCARFGLPSPITQAACGAAMGHLAATALLANPTPVILAGLIALMPGFMATIAVAELASGHLIAGMSRAAGALLCLIQLVVGVVLATTLVTPAPPLASTASAGALWLSALASAPPFAVLLGGRARSTIGIALGIVMAWQGTILASTHLGPLVGAGVGAFAVASFAQGWNRLTGRPAEVVAVPGLLLLVPGSVAFRGLEFLVAGDATEGVRLFAEVATTTVAIATGTLMGQRPWASPRVRQIQ